MGTTEKVLKDLVYTIGRMFYDPQCVFILDALTHFTAVKDAQLEQFLKVPIKELSKYIAVLREHKLIKVEIKPEKENDRVFQRSYFMIDYKNFVDVVKYRVHKIKEAVEAHSKTTDAPSKFKCPECNSPYSMLEAAALNFICDFCSSPVVEDTSKDPETSLTDEHRRRLNEQLLIVVDLLRKTEKIKLKAFHPALIVKQMQNNAKMGIPQRPLQSSIRDVSNLEDDEEQEAPDIRIQMEQNENAHLLKIQEAEKKRLENALPEWHTHSTVTGEQILKAVEQKTATVVSPITNQPAASAVSDYYETLKRSQLAGTNQNEHLEFHENDKKRKAEEIEEQEPMVSVQGELISVYDVTEEHKEKMTAAEYEAYFEVVDSLEE